MQASCYDDVMDVVQTHSVRHTYIHRPYSITYSGLDLWLLISHCWYFQTLPQTPAGTTTSSVDTVVDWWITNQLATVLQTTNWVQPTSPRVSVCFHLCFKVFAFLNIYNKTSVKDHPEIKTTTLLRPHNYWPDFLSFTPNFISIMNHLVIRPILLIPNMATL